MNQTLDFTQPGGLYTYQDTLKFMQDAYQTSIDALVQLYGDKVIVQGCVITGSNISSGWVVFNNQLLPVQGGALATYVSLVTTVTQEQFADGLARDFYTTKKLVFTATAAGNTAWSLFKNLPYKSATIYDALNTVKDIIGKVVGLESAVILSGLAVSNINTGASTCDIAAGSVLMDGNLISAQSYSGGYPVYLKNDGTWASAAPAGTYVLFDYETSQRYKDVLKRTMHGSGEVVMSSSANDLALFDASTGNGKWKWLGWKICNVVRSRSVVGYDNRTSNPGGADANAWDSANTSLGNKFGTNTVSIAKANLPNIKLKLENPYGDDPNYVNDTSGGGSKFSLKHDNDNDAGSGYIQTEALGSGTALDIRDSKAVMLFIERI